MRILWLAALLGQVGCAEWLFQHRYEDCSDAAQVEIIGARSLTYEQYNNPVHSFDCVVDLEFSSSYPSEGSQDVNRQGDDIVIEGYQDPEIYALSKLPALIYQDAANPVSLLIKGGDAVSGAAASDGDASLGAWEMTVEAPIQDVVNLDYLPGARLKLEANSMDSSLTVDTANVLLTGPQGSRLLAWKSFTELELEVTEAELVTVFVLDEASDFERLAMTSTGGTLMLWLPGGKYNFEIKGAMPAFPSGVEHSDQSAHRVVLDAATNMILGRTDEEDTNWWDDYVLD